MDDCGVKDGVKYLAGGEKCYIITLFICHILQGPRQWDVTASTHNRTSFDLIACSF